MDAKQKMKLCWNCEGRVTLDKENCPYCAVYLGPVLNGKEEKEALVPPYRLVETEEEKARHNQEIPPSPYAVENESEKNGVETAVVRKDLQTVVFPLLMLSGGVLFFLFGCLLFFFSDENVFTLSWDGKYWYLYFGFALPMLFLGWKALQQFPDDDEE